MQAPGGFFSLQDLDLAGVGKSGSPGDTSGMQPLHSISKRLLAGVCARLLAQDGQTLAEYAILLTVIALIAIAAAVLFGSSASSLFSSASRHL